MLKNRSLLFALSAFVAVLVGGSVVVIREIARNVEEVRVANPPAELAILAEVNSPQAGNLRLGDAMPDFTVQAQDGTELRLSSLIDGQRFVAINFHHPDCPCAENCATLINEMIDAGYDDVAWVGIMSHGWDNPREVAALQTQLDSQAVRFPVYKDADRAVQELLGATRTPEVWLLDKDGRVAFWGAPESTLFPGSQDHRFLVREAVDALRKGEEPEIRTFPPIGCPIEEKQQ